MGWQIIQDDDVARLKGRSRLSLDVSFENEPVHRRVNDKGGDQGVTSQAGDEGLRLQCPNGALERSLWPFGQRPRRRVILVVVPVSSTNTSRCGSSRMFGWRTPVHSSRACLTSGRSCSLARRIFFEATAGANDPTRQRSGISLLASCSGELGRQFRHGDVGLLGDLRPKETTDAVRAWRGVDRRSAWVRSFPASEPPSPASPRRKPTP